MIVLTGDVHHTSLRINDQRFISDSRDSEIRITRRYVDLLEEFGVKATLYVCGKCFTEEWSDLQPIVASPLVEIGGHGYRARQPRPLFDWYGRRTGNWNGPRWFQNWDIRRCVESCQQKTGVRPVSWRAHSFKIDDNTYPLLARHGFKVVSDEISASKRLPEATSDGLLSHAINTVPDHDHLYHAHRTREYVAKANAAGYGEDAFGAVSYSIEEWGDLILQQVAEIDSAGGVATVLAHPLCMYLSDEFRTFRRLLEAFSHSDCVWARDLLTPQVLDSPRPRIVDTHCPTGAALPD